ncbi:MAG: ferrous iron transport protein B [Desulfobacterales bacterium]
MDPKQIRIALAGNPNSGKTTIFNNITGTRQKVGNWPGVTVEKKEGRIHKFGHDLKIIDLPGTYSLTPFSIEEIVARDFILEEQPDVVIDIIDASNLERSLYLATQIRELDCKVLFALNMHDVARSRGIIIDADKLSQLLDVPVVFTVGNKNEGVDKLLEKAVELANSDIQLPRIRRVKYSKDIEKCIGNFKTHIENTLGDALPYNTRWTAIKLLEDDKILKDRIIENAGPAGSEILEQAEIHRSHIRNFFDEEPEIIFTDERYGFLAGIVKEVMTNPIRQRVDISRNIDLVLTNRFLGFPIFIFFIWAMFQLTFTIGAYPMEWIESGVTGFSGFVESIVPESLFKDLLVDGIIAGVGAVIIFLPNILILFFCIALFEDTGYMSRAAFLMDKIMHLIGLHGKSFIPMLMGFGCNVPAIMATRTLESEKDRILTILITPFMSCSARLPIYIVLAGTFFPQNAGTVIFSIYLAGIVMAIIMGRLFRSTLLRGMDAPFVMELPPYRVPMFKSLLIHMWDRSKMFLKKMGGIILIGSVIIWILSSFPRNIDYTKDYTAKIEAKKQTYQQMITMSDQQQLEQLRQEHERQIDKLQQEKRIETTENSYIGYIGRSIAPIFAPLGIDWRGSVALLTGFVAKEIVVSTMGVLYAGKDDEGEALKTALKQAGMTPLSALGMMFFVLLYVPCLATVVTIRKETLSWRWALFSVAYSTILAWITAFVIYQGGSLLGLG